MKEEQLAKISKAQNELHEKTRPVKPLQSELGQKTVDETMQWFEGQDDQAKHNFVKYMVSRKLQKIFTLE